MSTPRLPVATAAFWAKKEASYGSAIGDAEAGVRSTLWRGEPCSVRPDVTYSEQTGRSHEFREAADRLVQGWNTEFSRSFDLDVEVAGWALAFALGTVSSADAGSGGTRHTFKPIIPSSSVAPALPSTTLVEYFADEGLKTKFPGVTVASVGISGQKGQGLQLQWGGVGNGKADTSTSLTMPSLTTALRIMFEDITVFNGAASGARDLRSRLRSFEWGWDNSLMVEDGRLAGATMWNGGPLLSRCEIGNRMDTGILTLTIDAQRGATDELTELLAATQWTDVVMTCKARTVIGGAVYPEVKLIIPKAYVDELEGGWEGDIKVRKLRVQPVWDSSSSAPLRAEVVNTVSAYLTAAA